MDGLESLEKVRAMCAQLERPMWMPNPRSWLWSGPDGKPQGLAYLVDTEPGAANLMWLALDMGTPPRTCDIRTHPLIPLLFVGGMAAHLAGEPLLDAASLLTLQQFHDKLPDVAPPGANPVERTYPLLKLLAKRRLLNADT